MSCNTIPKADVFGAVNDLLDFALLFGATSRRNRQYPAMRDEYTEREIYDAKRGKVVTLRTRKTTTNRW